MMNNIEYRDFEFIQISKKQKKEPKLKEVNIQVLTEF